MGVVAKGIHNEKRKKKAKTPTCAFVLYFSAFHSLSSLLPSLVAQCSQCRARYNEMRCTHMLYCSFPRVPLRYRMQWQLVTMMGKSNVNEV